MSVVYVYIFCALILAVLLYNRLKPFVSARMAGIKVSLSDVLGMYLRRVSVDVILNSGILAKKNGLSIDLATLEAHYLAGGNVNLVTFALVAAKKANLELTFTKAAAIDLVGYNVLDEVRLAMKSRVLQTPLVKTIANDGKKVSVALGITVKSNLQRVVGGAGEDVLIAKICEKITTLVSSANHNQLLANPEIIINEILESQLDATTSLEIISIEFVDIF